MSSPQEYLLKLVGLLGQTLSPDQAVRQPAEQQLLAYELVSGFCSMLYEIIITKTIDVNIRLVAELYLKNTVSKHWKKPRGSEPGISEEEKATLRGKLLQNLDEDAPKVTLNLAILISVIARLDYAQHWPDLLPRLLQLLQQPPAVGSPYDIEKYRQRVLLILHHVVKALCSRRLLSSRKEFEQVTPSLFSFMSSLWASHINTLLSALSAFASNSMSHHDLLMTAPVAESTKLCLKIIRRLIVYGLPNLHLRQDVVEFLKLIHNRLGTLILCKEQVGNNPLSDYVNDFILLCTKMITEIQASQKLPFSASNCLQPFLELLTSELVKTSDSNSKRSERFCIQCMLFLKGVLETEDYRTPPDDGSTSTTAVQKQQAHQVVSSFFSPERVTQLVRVIIVKIFPLNEQLMQEWNDNPEEFFCEEEADDSEKKKPCAENLYLTMLTQFRTWLPPLVMQTVKQIMDETRADVSKALLMMDACYLAIGLGYYDLFEYVDFASWFTNDLSKQLMEANAHPNGVILRRRIAWLIGRWVGKVTKEMRATIYRCLLTLLADSNIVVSLTAATSLKHLIDDFNFEVDAFLEFLEPVIGLLFQLLDKVEECDTKLQVLSVITVLFDQVGEKVTPHISKIILYLKHLWKTAETNEAYNLLRQSIVRAATKLVQSIPASDGSDNNAQFLPALLEFVLPIIHHSTDIHRPDSVYLLEDGLHLWHSTISQFPHQIRSLLPLYPNITALIRTSLDQIKLAMKIIEEYLIVGKEEFLKVYLQDLVSTFELVIGNVKDHPTMWTLKPLELLIQLFPQQAPPYLNHLLQKILSFLLSGKESDFIVVYYLSIFARILLENQGFFFSFFQKVSESTPNRQPLLPGFLDFWLDKFDNMAQPKTRKLSALALCNLLPTKDHEILKYTGQIVNVCISVLNYSVLEDKENDTAWLEDLEGEIEPTQTGLLTRQQLVKSDPVSNLDLRSHLLQRLNECAALNGGEVFQQVMQSMDPTIFAQLQQLMKPT